MNKKVNSRVVMMERVRTFLREHPLTAPIPRVSELAALIDTLVTHLRSCDLDQDSGRGETRAMTVARHEKAASLRADMRKISNVAKGMSRELYPGLATQFRMPIDSYPALLTRARAFLEAIAPVKVGMIARGLPADFDEQLQSKIADFEALNQRRDRGLTEQIGGTAGMETLARTGAAHVAELDSMLAARYADDPVLTAAWKSAKRIRRSNAKVEAAPTPTPQFTLSVSEAVQESEVSAPNDQDSHLRSSVLSAVRNNRESTTRLSGLVPRQMLAQPFKGWVVPKKNDPVALATEEALVLPARPH